MRGQSNRFAPILTGERKVRVERLGVGGKGNRARGCDNREGVGGIVPAPQAILVVLFRRRKRRKRKRSEGVTRGINGGRNSQMLAKKSSLTWRMLTSIDEIMPWPDGHLRGW